MSARQANQQADLLRRAVLDVEPDRVPPEIRATVIGLLKKLLTECAPGVVKVRSADE